jgi:hypothetical protein
VQCESRLFYSEARINRLSAFRHGLLVAPLLGNDAFHNRQFNCSLERWTKELRATCLYAVSCNDGSFIVAQVKRAEHHFRRRLTFSRRGLSLFAVSHSREKKFLQHFT